MKICAAQFRPAAGDFTANILKHHDLIQLAVSQGASLVFFPELSLTGFEPRLAESLASNIADPRLDLFQRLSDQNSLLIGVGMPVAGISGVQIGMVWFAPGIARRLYAKQHLHVDEQPYFVCGQEQLLLECGGHKLAPAICYESLQMDHADRVTAAEVYLASVAKPAGALAKARAHYPAVARKHAMFVIMANCVGPSDNFVSGGQSAAWNTCGELLVQMDGESEGLIILDIEQATAHVYKLDSP